MKERILKDVLTIDFSIGFDELIEKMFWKDQYFYSDDTIYIKDTYFNEWYILESRYYYASVNYIIENKLKVNFHRIEDEGIKKDLEVFFL